MYRAAKGINSSYVTVYDLIKGTSWQKEKMFKTKAYVEIINSDPIDADENGFVVSTDYALYYVKGDDGEIVWRSSTAGAVVMTNTTNAKPLKPGEAPPAKLYKHRDKPYIYHFSLAGVKAYNINTGKKAWKKAGKGSDRSTVIFDKEGLIVCGNKIRMYDYDTGVPKWDKPAKLKGWVSQYRYTENGLLVAMIDQAANIDIAGGTTDRQSRVRLNVVNLTDGKFIHDKDVMTRSNLVDLKLFVHTDELVNIYDPKTGKMVFEEPIKVNKRRRLMVAGNYPKVYVFSSKTDQVYEIDQEARTLKQITSSEIKFKDGGSPRSMEVVETGILLYSKQNMMLLNFDGSISYNLNLPAPKLSFLERAILSTAALAMQHSLNKIPQLKASINNRPDSPYGLEKYDQQARSGLPWNENVAAAADHSLIMGMWGRRWKASEETTSYIFINTVFDPSVAFVGGNYGVVKIDKATGKYLKIFPFGQDKKPRYNIDEMSGKLFYAGNGQITCYTL